MSTQISLSLELISLLNWLLKHEKVMLNSLVKNAIERGFGNELEKLNDTNQASPIETLQEPLINFLEHLEHNLIKNVETIYLEHKIKHEVVPTLQKIESDSIDDKTLWLSVQQTTDLVNKQMHIHQHTNQPRERKKIIKPLTQGSQEILCEQLLKNWKPNNKEAVN